MKTIQLLTCLACTILIYSCNSNKCDSIVKINPEGTCSREYIVSSNDSAFMNGDTASNPFPMKIDSSWNIQWKYSSPKKPGVFSKWPAKNWSASKDTSLHLTLTLLAHKDYPNVETMAKTFRYDHSQWQDLRPKMTLEKKFRFFFTFFTYREVYPKNTPVSRVPIDKYLTNEEINLYFTNDPKFDPTMIGAEIKEVLDRIDKKKDFWLNHNIFEEVYYQFVPLLKTLEKTKIDSVSYLQAKDSVFMLFKESDDMKSNFSLMLNKYFKTKEFTDNPSIKEFIAQKCDQVTEKIIQGFAMEIGYKLIMPGKVLQTTAKQTQGDTLNWKLEPYRFTFTDYELMAESRVPNIWAFVLSGVFLIIVAVSFLIKKKP